MSGKLASRKAPMYSRGEMSSLLSFGSSAVASSWRIRHQFPCCVLSHVPSCWPLLTPAPHMPILVPVHRCTTPPSRAALGAPSLTLKEDTMKKLLLCAALITLLGSAWAQNATTVVKAGEVTWKDHPVF